MGGRGVWKMMTYDDRGRGAYEIMTSSIKEVFCSSIQKRSLKVNCSMPRRLSISDSNCAWNSFQKERHIVYVVEKKYMLNEFVVCCWKKDSKVISHGVAGCGCHML